MDINEYIQSRVDDQINWYSKKSQMAQKRYKIFQTVEIIMAALIPLLSGYAGERMELFQHRKRWNDCECVL